MSDNNERDERRGPEPPAIEGHHAGRKVDDPLRQTMDDTGVGAVSRPAGESMADEDDELSGSGNYGESGESGAHQGSESIPHAGRGSSDPGAYGHHAAGAFGDEQPGGDEDALDDFGDKGLEKFEQGSTTSS